MPSGSSVHRALVHRIAGVKKAIEHAADDIETRESEITDLQERKSDRYRALAEFHLPEMSAEGVAGTLTEMSDRVRGIYDDKQARWAELSNSSG